MGGKAEGRGGPAVPRSWIAAPRRRTTRTAATIRPLTTVALVSTVELDN